jgi:hypothetical protein
VIGLTARHGPWRAGGLRCLRPPPEPLAGLLVECEVRV